MNPENNNIDKMVYRPQSGINPDIGLSIVVGSTASKTKPLRLLIDCMVPPKMLASICARLSISLEFQIRPVTIPNPKGNKNCIQHPMQILIALSQTENPDLLITENFNASNPILKGIKKTMKNRAVKK